MSLLKLTTVAHGESVQKLAQFQWKNRLIVGKTEDARFVQHLQERASRLTEEITDRDLLILIHYRDRWLILGTEHPPQLHDQLMAEIQTKTRKHDLALIGLDGGVKNRYSIATFSLMNVFQQIDRMPMRMRELAEQE
ncbi:MAG: DUF4174 domain-containing protein [Verrucomicrobiota bacterium]